jgi:RNA recognition motif-containing protein
MSNKKLYVGNLSFKCTDEDLSNLFAQFGDVISARVITDRDTGRSKGFGFVEMLDADAENAIQNLNGFSFSGREISVNEARPQGERPAFGQRDRGGQDNRSRGFNAR